jgi:hypothetical protein
MSNVSLYRASLLASFDARAAYELAKNVENTSMQDTLRDLRKSVDHDAICEVMMNANVDCAFINRAERVNARFNVYAAQKVVNVARFSRSAATLNHYTRAVLLSAYALQKNNMTLTHTDAQAACSLNCNTDKSKMKHLVRYQQYRDPKTAATQSSSSINALQMYDVLRETRDASNATVYTVNLDSALARDLLQRCDVKFEDEKSEDANAE